MSSDKKPERVWLQGNTAFDIDPRLIHDNGKAYPEYIRADLAIPATCPPCGCEGGVVHGRDCIDEMQHGDPGGICTGAGCKNCPRCKPCGECNGDGEIGGCPACPTPDCGGCAITCPDCHGKGRTVKACGECHACITSNLQSVIANSEHFKSIVWSKLQAVTKRAEDAEKERDKVLIDLSIAQQMITKLTQDALNWQKQIGETRATNAKLKAEVERLKGMLTEVAPFTSSYSAPQDLQDRIDAIAYPEEPAE